MLKSQRVKNTILSTNLKLSLALSALEHARLYINSMPKSFTQEMALYTVDHALLMGREKDE